MGDKHGNGEYEVYESGKRIAGQFVNDKAEGEFKCYDKEGNMTILHFKDYLFKNSRVKDGVIVPGQVGLSGPPSLVRGPYPH